eukprot:m.103668 g.103668  ORF g.103668 m.103668 type:complete len:586 (-) comp15724_c0_seq1:48-1805(-)
MIIMKAVCYYETGILNQTQPASCGALDERLVAPRRQNGVVLAVVDSASLATTTRHLAGVQEALVLLCVHRVAAGIPVEAQVQYDADAVDDDKGDGLEVGDAVDLLGVGEREVEEGSGQADGRHAEHQGARHAAGEVEGPRHVRALDLEVDKGHQDEDAGGADDEDANLHEHVVGQPGHGQAEAGHRDNVDGRHALPLLDPEIPQDRPRGVGSQVHAAAEERALRLDEAEETALGHHDERGVQTNVVDVGGDDEADAEPAAKQLLGKVGEVAGLVVLADRVQAERDGQRHDIHKGEQGGQHHDHARQGAVDVLRLCAEGADGVEVDVEPHGPAEEERPVGGRVARGGGDGVVVKDRHAVEDKDEDGRQADGGEDGAEAHKDVGAGQLDQRDGDNDDHGKAADRGLFAAAAQAGAGVQHQVLGRQARIDGAVDDVRDHLPVAVLEADVKPKGLVHPSHRAAVKRQRRSQLRADHGQRQPIDNDDGNHSPVDVGWRSSLDHGLIAKHAAADEEVGDDQQREEAEALPAVAVCGGGVGGGGSTAARRQRQSHGGLWLAHACLPAGSAPPRPPLPTPAAPAATSGGGWWS